MREEKLRAGKFDVDVPLVERLVATQFPQWAGLPIRPVERDGWDNWTFHLGNDMKVRLPSAMGYAEQAEKEAYWLPRLAPHLPLPVPVPIGIGRPAEGYPCPWSIYRWLEGEPVTRENVDDAVQFGWDLAKFLIALQRIDATGGPPPGQHNYFRGADVMAAYGDEARRSIDSIAETIDAPAAHAVLDAAAAAPFTGPPVWLHGDIAAGNLLQCEGQLAAVIDFGGCAVGDPACDLVIAWVFLDGAGRDSFRLSMPADDAMWARARAWALWKAALMLANGMVDNPSENAPRAVIDAVIAEHRAGVSRAAAAS
ncbi:MAG: aminoglycoside phosphotransferase family protein [Devosia sp.]|jgi:aminoglycoside phosphotransferase (APT) family kinase protein